MTRKILIVDDNTSIQTLLTDFLGGQGYELACASDGFTALRMLPEFEPDLVLLDIMMPHKDGWQFITELRKSSALPVIMITARQQEEDVIKGFDLGADDYITKPFKLRELLVRVRAVLKRAQRQSASNAIIIGDITLDADRHLVTRAGETIDLTPTEFFILSALMQQPGRLLKRVELAVLLAEAGFAGSEATIKIHISNIRAKLQDSLDEPRYIETVFGLGYRFLESPA